MSYRTLGVALLALSLAACSEATSPVVSPETETALVKVNSRDLSVSRSGNVVTASFRFTGLGNVGSINVTLASQVTEEVRCTNGGGHVSSVHSASRSATASDVFTSGKNGSVSGTLSVAGSDLSAYTCPNGHRRSTHYSFGDVTLSWFTSEGASGSRNFGSY